MHRSLSAATLSGNSRRQPSAVLNTGIMSIGILNAGILTLGFYMLGFCTLKKSEILAANSGVARPDLVD